MTTTRYRCTACGNLTRFDVTTTSRTRAFHHYTVGGHLQVEDAEILEETVEDVSCRWCGNGRSVVPVSEQEAADAAGSQGSDATGSDDGSSR